MQLPGAPSNKMTRWADPASGGQRGTPGFSVVEVVVVEVDVVVVVVVVVGAAALDPWFTANTMPTMAAARTASPKVRRVLRLRLRLFWISDCFCSRAARCRALLSVGTERHATEPAGQRASALGSALARTPFCDTHPAGSGPCRATSRTGGSLAG